MFRKYFIPVAFLVSLVSLIYGQDDITDAIEKRLEISARLDSLELEKQKMKRAGKPIKELESVSSLLRDSIELLREQMPINTEMKGSANKSNSGRSSFIAKPESLFDWLIYAAGGAAVLSGIVLLFGILSSVKKRKKIKNIAPVTTLSQKMSSNKNGLLNIPISNEKPVNIPRETPKQDLDGINKLREKMQSGAQAAPSPVSPFERNPASPPVQQAPQAAAPNISKPAPKPLSQGAGDLKQAIITASQRGLSDAEIAKEFKVSIDQVALIIKMSNGSMRGA